MANQKKKTLPPQHQNRQPGFEYVMDPRPVFDKPKAAKNLKEKLRLLRAGTAESDAPYPFCSRRKAQMWSSFTLMSIRMPKRRSNM